MPLQGHWWGQLEGNSKNLACDITTGILWGSWIPKPWCEHHQNAQTSWFLQWLRLTQLSCSTVFMRQHAGITLSHATTSLRSSHTVIAPAFSHITAFILWKLIAFVLIWSYIWLEWLNFVCTVKPAAVSQALALQCSASKGRAASSDCQDLVFWYWLFFPLQNWVLLGVKHDTLSRWWNKKMTRATSVHGIHLFTTKHSTCPKFAISSSLIGMGSLGCPGCMGHLFESWKLFPAKYALANQKCYALPYQECWVTEYMWWSSASDRFTQWARHQVPGGQQGPNQYCLQCPCGVAWNAVPELCG